MQHSSKHALQILLLLIIHSSILYAIFETMKTVSFASSEKYAIQRKHLFYMKVLIQLLATCKTCQKKENQTQATVQSANSPSKTPDSRRFPDLCRARNSSLERKV